MIAPGGRLAPGLTVIEHLSRTRRLDTYEVWSHERACSCVAKTLRPDRRHDERARSALVHEGRLLRDLTHPHIVRGYELRLEPEPIVVMETLDGVTVAHLVDRHPGGMDHEDVAWLGLHLASALHHLHGHGVLHLDVKPSNVVADAGRAKLIDLSLARPPGLRSTRWATVSPSSVSMTTTGSGSSRSSEPRTMCGCVSSISRSASWISALRARASPRRSGRSVLATHEQARSSLHTS